MATVKFMPADVVEEYHDGETLFDIGARTSVKIETACVGKGTCGLCRVIVLEGEEHLNEYTDPELEHLGNMYFLTKMRLSCRAIAAGGDVVVELKPKRKRRKKK